MNRFFFVLILVVLGAMSRLLPHELNFAPVAALGLFSGAVLLHRGWSMALPILALLLSDIVIYVFDPLGTNPHGQFFHNDAGFLIQRVFDFGSFALIALIGRHVGQFITPLRVLSGAVAGSLVFFLISNLGYYFIQDMGPNPIAHASLLGCYIQAIPFYKATLIGDLVYSALFFGAYALFVRYMRSRLSATR